MTGQHDGPDAAGGDAPGRGSSSWDSSSWDSLDWDSLDWAALPDLVRGRLAELAAGAVGELSRADLPPRLRPVARFAPAKRASRAAQQLLTELRDSALFRAAVLRWATEHRPSEVDPDNADAVTAAAAAVLHGTPDAPEKVKRLADQAQQSGLRAQRDAAIAQVARLEADVARLRAELADAREATEQARAERRDELDRLRGRLRAQGQRLRDALDTTEQQETAVARARAELADELAELRAQRDAERERAERERGRAERASQDAELARAAAKQGRQVDEVRLALLLDSAEGALHGLRRELSIDEAASRQGRPADWVAGASAGSGAGGSVGDAAALGRLLTLPSVHLIVDGYNVTKTGYPELSLADQRDRLVRQLAALAARTSAEVTVVFDGAGVVAVPTVAPRSVRVLFSDPGVTADEVIRNLVAAEPGGRPMVVATADRAVATGIRADGAHPVASAVLLDMLGRS
ncbi:putative RNA-binding protein with PIN domain [Tamaricihabitans halophyticus]|uniref:Putative RNA-binding protein with PIN domain n=1 Tax=Tamaricihabitans halophyticus TaxID=1262583 RepID=A0A4R2QY52_9PSEU|nr:NYN domain-containing protein [Tamaricihabitans halophyticus]TCP55103.1 putative RNA-binding protein with PIN domain [Tamaricihabitans halophyticus]